MTEPTTINITLYGKNGEPQIITAHENQSIMLAAVGQDIRGIDGVCGGSMGCATCHVVIHPDWVERVISQDNEKSEEEMDMLETAAYEVDTSRLGCQIKITKALEGLEIALPNAKLDWT